MKITKVVKWVFAIMVICGVMLSRSAVADMMDLYMQGVLPSIIGSNQGTIPPIPTDLGFEKPQSLNEQI